MPPMNLGATTVTGPVLGLAGQLVLLAALAAGVGVTPIGWLAGAGYAAVSAGALAVGLRRTRAARLGAANAVTLVRSSLVVGVTALVAGATAGGLPGDALVALTALAFVALVLDGVDGQVARRTGTSSALGARFDMEVDAFLILVLSIAVARTAGWWVLAIGALRYAFVAASWALPWLKASLPPRFGRKVVAAMQGIVLAVAASGLVWEPLAVASVAAALAVLLWSFGRDVVWLWATRGQVGADVVAAPTPAPAPAPASASASASAPPADAAVLVPARFAPGSAPAVLLPAPAARRREPARVGA